MAEVYDPAQLADAARAGDSDAQYRLASLLIQTEGEEARAVDWLRKAAAAGHSGARYTLAIFTASGIHVPKAPDRAVNLLETIAHKDEPAARQFLSVLLASGYRTKSGTDKAPDWSAALEHVREGSVAGEAFALRDMALLLAITDRNADIRHYMLMAAASRGDVLAAGLLTALYLDGDDRLAQAEIAALGAMITAGGYPLASVWRPHLPDVEPAQLNPYPVPNLTELPWQELAASLAERPQGAILSPALRRAACAHMIALGAPYMQATPGVDGHFSAVLGPQHLDLFTTALGARVAALVNGRIEASPMLLAAGGAAGQYPLSPAPGQKLFLLALSDNAGGGIAPGGGGEVVRPAVGEGMIVDTAAGMAGAFMVPPKKSVAWWMVWSITA